ncbi:unnamed protein product [Closterium sp. NIES-53]
MTTLWVLLHVATWRDYELHSLDFSTAFLTTLAALGFAPSSADPSLFLRTDTTLPPLYVNDLVFATADTEALALVKAELQERHTCTDLGPSVLRLPVLLATAHSSVYRPLALSSTFGRVCRAKWSIPRACGLPHGPPIVPLSPARSALALSGPARSVLRCPAATRTACPSALPSCHARPSCPRAATALRAPIAREQPLPRAPLLPANGPCLARPIAREQPLPRVPLMQASSPCPTRHSCPRAALAPRAPAAYEQPLPCAPLLPTSSLCPSTPQQPSAPRSPKRVSAPRCLARQRALQPSTPVRPAAQRASAPRC